jgi:hypothetical protein
MRGVITQASTAVSSQRDFTPKEAVQSPEHEELGSQARGSRSTHNGRETQVLSLAP